VFPETVYIGGRTLLCENMAPPPSRLRYAALLPLWSLVTRAVVKDASLNGWGFSFALLSATFFLFVSRSQLPWLGRSRNYWWVVGIRAEIAAFVSVITPKSWLLPLFVFVAVFRATGVYVKVDGEETLWKCIPLILLLRPSTGYFVDILQVGLLVASRHYVPVGVQDEPAFYKEHERRLLLDLFGVYVLSSAGALYSTRLALLFGSAALTLFVHFKYPRTRGVGFWDAINSEKRHTTVPFREMS